MCTRPQEGQVLDTGPLGADQTSLQPKTFFFAPAHFTNTKTPTTSARGRQQLSVVLEGYKTLEVFLFPTRLCTITAFNALHAHLTSSDVSSQQVADFRVEAPWLLSKSAG